MIMDLIIIGLLAGLGRVIPDTLPTVILLGFATLAPSPLSKTSIAPDVDATNTQSKSSYTVNTETSPHGT